MTAGAIAVPTVIPLRLPSSGRTKNNIDSNTLIEIHSDTPGTKIYYTVDNTRPDPVKKLGENTTLLYKQPFMLRDGKRYVKALARTKDGRESNVVTKVFTVDYAEPQTSSDSESEGTDDSNKFQKELSNHSQIESRNITTSLLKGSPYARSQEAWGEIPTSPMHDLRISNDSLMRASLNSSRKDILSHRSGDFVRCVYCDMPRPRDSSSRFCPDCGKPVPVDPNEPTNESASMGMCTKCRSYVPLTQSKCIVCEEPIGPKLKPTASVRLQDGIVCGSCGTNNPSHLTHCASCEHRFPTPVHTGSNAPPLPRLDGALVRCPGCTRVNNPDARFCDWCGEKPIPEQSPMTCSLCKHNNRPYSKFCSQCGSKFVPPDRMDPRNLDLGEQTQTYPFGNLPMWQTVPLPTLPKSPQSTRMVRALKPRSREVQTQTVGMFYPGGKKVVQEQEMLLEMRDRELRMRDKQPALTAVSPGKGYWRKQMDHICGHLRGYTNNNVEFRSVIGEPKLGKILSTAIDEGEEEMTLSMTFALRGHTEFGDGGFRGLQRDLYQSKKKIAFGSTFEPDENEPEKKKKTKKGKKKSAIKEEKLNPEDRLLLKELGPRGDGRVEEVKQLLKEGASPNCIDSERRCALCIAVMKERYDCVQALLKGGADVNRRSGPQHNTPLHHAVKMGPNGKDMVKMLLEWDAKKDLKNERGLSAYDTAVRADYNSILALFNEPIETKKLRPKPKSRKSLLKPQKKISSSDDSDSEIDVF
ncbi:double zinc ribbon and ankyrin repeat-containing protein 1-like [Clavelina lepadiformis]|uniref:double zinc ribbon and ankyrin repeat-containing protein 1-like n=1 Tax=Clavelina lepadiformis TaxID=159417 RepID=UPI0040417720